MILVDTSVYISALADSGVENVLKKAGKKAFIISSEVVEREIEKASDFLRKRGDKVEAQKLKELYTEVISGTIRLTDRAVEISDRYSSEVRKNISKTRAHQMKDDLRIVSSAAVGGIEATATFNRKTMANQEIVIIYNEINAKYKLKTPRFIRTKEELSRFLSSG